LGLDYGLSPFRIQVAIFRWPAGFAQRHPAVIDATRMSWFRPEGAAATLIGVELGAAHADPEKFDEGVDAAYVASCREALTARLPVRRGPAVGGRRPLRRRGPHRLSLTALRVRTGST